jgi:hypothetical protein
LPSVVTYCREPFSTFLRESESRSAHFGTGNHTASKTPKSSAGLEQQSVPLKGQFQSLRSTGENADTGRRIEVQKSSATPHRLRKIAGRTIPNLRDGLKLQAFLKKQRRAKPRGGMNWIAIIF